MGLSWESTRELGNTGKTSKLILQKYMFVLLSEATP
jgi:hypothetical protein